MRVFLPLLALSFACAEEEYLYSVSWNEDSCTEDEDVLFLDAISNAVDGVLEAASIPKVKAWKKKVKNLKTERELEQTGTRGRRDLCFRQCFTACRMYPACSEIYNCDECRRNLIQTERALTDRELKTLEDQLVTACSEALATEGQSNVFGQYSQGCKDAMSVATCNALVYHSD
jgi:hypothetical protein